MNTQDHLCSKASETYPSSFTAEKWAILEAVVTCPKCRKTTPAAALVAPRKALRLNPTELLITINDSYDELKDVEFASPIIVHALSKTVPYVRFVSGKGTQPHGLKTHCTECGADLSGLCVSEYGLHKTFHLHVIGRDGVVRGLTRKSIQALKFISFASSQSIVPPIGFNHFALHPLGEIMEQSDSKMLLSTVIGPFIQSAVFIEIANMPSGFLPSVIKAEGDRLSVVAFTDFSRIQQNEMPIYPVDAMTLLRACCSARMDLEIDGGALCIPTSSLRFP